MAAERKEQILRILERAHSVRVTDLRQLLQASEASVRRDLLMAGEPPDAVKAYLKARTQKESGDLKGAVASLEKLLKD